MFRARNVWLTCSSRNVCWHDRMSKTRYLLICSNEKNIICRIDEFIRMLNQIYQKLCNLQTLQCIKTNFTKISFHFFVLQYNQTNYTMIAIKLSRNLNQCKIFRIQINKIYQAIRSSKFDKSWKRSVWSRQHQIFDWIQQVHIFE